MCPKRIITATDSDGKSFALYDNNDLERIDLGAGIFHEVWTDSIASVEREPQNDPAKSEFFRLLPNKGEVKFRLFTLLPEQALGDTHHSILKSLKQFGDRIVEQETGSLPPESKTEVLQEPQLHATATKDYGIVLSGRVSLLLDSGEVELQKGDVIVQRSTRHTWRNRGVEPCTMAFVMVSKVLLSESGAL